jgi:carbamoyl-phosphate synthase large subunit
VTVRPNVLLTSASRKVSLVRAFQRALWVTGGGKVIAVDTSPLSAALYVADDHELVLPSSDPGAIDQLVAICKKNDVGLVVPTRDEELAWLSEHDDALRSVGATPLASSAQAIRTCQDKRAFLEFCKLHGFAVAACYEGPPHAPLPQPLFLRPRFGKGSVGATRVTSSEQLAELLRASPDAIVQHVVTAPEFTLDVCADFDGRVLTCVPRERLRVVAGESYVSRTLREPALLELGERLTRTLGLIGHVTIQCFWTGTEAFLIEVNPRFGGAANLGFEAGARTPELLLRSLRGERLSPSVGEFRDGLVMLRHTDDLFIPISMLAKHKVAPSPVLPPRAVLFDLDDTLFLEADFVWSGLRAAADCLARESGREREPLLARMVALLKERGRGRVFDNLVAELGLPVQASHRALWHYRTHPPRIALVPGGRETLLELRQRGFRTGVVTDGMASVQDRKIRALGLDHLVDTVVCTDDLGLGCSKPSTTPFLVALGELGVLAKDAAYVGNDASKDFLGPNQLGMLSLSIHHPGGHVAAPPSPDHVAQRELASLEALLDWVPVTGGVSHG